MDELIPKLNESLIMDTSNILGDYLEIGIDSIINDDIIKEIPNEQLSVDLHFFCTFM